MKSLFVVNIIKYHLVVCETAQCTTSFQKMFNRVIKITVKLVPLTTAVICLYTGSSLFKLRVLVSVQ